jgi:hypothetical protein
VARQDSYTQEGVLNALVLGSFPFIREQKMEMSLQGRLFFGCCVGHSLLLRAQVTDCTLTSKPKSLQLEMQGTRWLCKVVYIFLLEFF